MSDLLNKAREFEDTYKKYADKERPAFHLTGGIGWINDPNGFSLYKEDYHLFFQYHPFSTHWGPMYWGHVKTKDFIKWERLPIAMAPDSEVDEKGCFSGSAIELEDGKQLLMYTGVKEVRRSDGILEDIQQQCIALGDGVDYEKIDRPVLSAQDLPVGASEIDFRDPKIWKEDGKYYVVIGNRTEDGSGAVLLYESEDALHWEYRGIIDRSYNVYGKMWECPDFFELDGKRVLITSPQEMIPIGLEFHAGYGVMALLGEYDKNNYQFNRESVQSVDYGIDFYAPQTLETKDGRRVMIAWMQNWTNIHSQPSGIRLFGSMTCPRELHVENGRLIQNPVKELEAYRTNKVVYKEVPIQTVTSLEGVSGRIIDLTVTVKGKNYSKFKMHIGQDKDHYVSIRYRKDKNVIRVDRTRSGGRFDIVHVRDFVIDEKEELKLRFLIDKYSVELFVNDGRQAATFMIYSPLSAEGITFESDEMVRVDVEKYDIEI
ncbi:MAG: glycoside hydrolase family 32 protein [Firmicutes bacterium]|nr:glycoside hydrolase family 32 protein [Bacillota bacterium]